MFINFVLMGLVAFFLFGLPIAIGLAYILPDANRSGQPGTLWALLTIPLGWLAVLVYLAVRGSSARQS